MKSVLICKGVWNLVPQQSSQTPAESNVWLGRSHELEQLMVEAAYDSSGLGQGELPSVLDISKNI